MLVALAAAVALAIAALSSKLSDCFSYSLGVVLAPEQNNVISTS